MCNAWHHPFGCACGFGPPILGYHVNDLIGFLGRSLAKAVITELSPAFWEPVAKEIKASAYKTIDNYKQRGISYGYGWEVKVNIPSEFRQKGMEAKLANWLKGLKTDRKMKVIIQDKKTKDKKTEVDENGKIIQEVVIKSRERDIKDKDLEPLLGLLKESSNKESDDSKEFLKTINSIKNKSKIRVCNEFVWDVLINAGLQPGPSTGTKDFNSSELFVEVTEPLPGDVAMVGGYKKNEEGKLEWHGHTGICLDNKGGHMTVAHIGRRSGPSQIKWSAITADKDYKGFNTRYYRPIMGSKSFKKYYDKIAGGFSKKLTGKSKK